MRPKGVNIDVESVEDQGIGRMLVLKWFKLNIQAL
jgi:hypothetical protein